MSNNNGLIPASSVPSVYSSTPYATPAPSVVNNIVSGTIPPLATNYNNDGCYFIKKGEPIDGPLISQVNILSADLSSTARITVTGDSDSSYKGAITLNSGANNSGSSQVILTGRTVGPTTAQIEIGDNAQTNKLLIAGNDGLSQVYDAFYNRPYIVGPNITGNYITNSPNAGTLFSTFDSDNFVLNNLGFYRFELNISLPANQEVNFNPASCYTFLISNPNETTFSGSITMTAGQIFSNFNSQFPGRTPNFFQFSTQLFLGAGTYKIKGDQAQGPPFIFGPNMDSVNAPQNFQFSVFQIAPLTAP